MPIPGLGQLNRAYQHLSPAEFVVFLLAGLLLIVGTAGVVNKLQNQFSITQPTHGGSFSEGLVGYPRHINPVLASTDTDRDLTSLVYAGLTKLDSSGNIDPDLASSIKVSSDGKTYTLTISPDAYFHDGHPVEAEDVAYTLDILTDQRIGSPYQVNWTDVQVRVIDKKTIAFDLSEPFHNFLYSTRIGILPKHHWQNEPSQTFAFTNLNTEPIGAGPYKVSSIERDSEGIPVSYELTAADTYTPTPYIEKIKFEFFPDRSSLQEALEAGSIDAAYGFNPDAADQLTDKNKQVVTQPLNRVFAVFFNQNNNEILIDSTVRQALSRSIPKQEIIDTVMSGYGSSIDGPLPATSSSTIASNLTAEAAELLETAGWTYEENAEVRSNDGDVLRISLSTANLPALEQTAEIIASNWKNIGIDVTVTTLPVSDLMRDTIRPRQYDALLFGQLINQSQDLYPFWHSDNQNYPGLNLAMYANTDVDTALETLQTASSTTERVSLQQQVVNAIIDDQPASFIYTPDFIYIIPKKIQQTVIPPITNPADRFSQIEDWYIKTNNLWKIFSSSTAGKKSETKAEISTSTSQ